MTPGTNSYGEGSKFLNRAYQFLTLHISHTILTHAVSNLYLKVGEFRTLLDPDFVTFELFAPNRDGITSVAVVSTTGDREANTKIVPALLVQLDTKGNVVWWKQDSKIRDCKVPTQPPPSFHLGTSPAENKIRGHRAKVLVFDEVSPGGYFGDKEITTMIAKNPELDEDQKEGIKRAGLPVPEKKTREDILADVSDDDPIEKTVDQLKTDPTDKIDEEFKDLTEDDGLDLESIDDEEGFDDL